MDEKQEEQPQNLEGEIHIASLRQEAKDGENISVISETEIVGEIQLPKPANQGAVLTKEDLGVKITTGAQVRPLRSHPPNPEDGISHLLEWRQRQKKLIEHLKKAA